MQVLTNKNISFLTLDFFVSILMKWCKFSIYCILDPELSLLGKILHYIHSNYDHSTYPFYIYPSCILVIQRRKKIKIIIQISFFVLAL
jgi:hypothetical protein